MNQKHYTQPQNESIKVDAKNLTLEATGLITIVVVVGVFILTGAYIYGKFLHVKVKEKIRSRYARRKTRKTKKKHKAK